MKTKKKYTNRRTDRFLIYSLIPSKENEKKLNVMLIYKTRQQFFLYFTFHFLLILIF